ncbi:MAG: hypothetical protein WC494_00945 [Candidatus Pacearchaeota archaeon]
MKQKKGVFFSIDALIALIIIFITVIIFVPIVYYPQHETFLEEDIITSFSSLKIGEVENDLVKELILQGEIKELNHSILEALGELYVRNVTLSKSVAQDLIDRLNVGENIGIWYDNDLLASTNSTTMESAREVRVERQIISGIKKGEEIKGYVAKAWLKKISEKKNSLFIKGDNICGGWTHYSWGDYCSVTQNKISYIVEAPENSEIVSASWLLEGSWVNQYFQVFVNGNKIYDGLINYYKIFNITSYLNPGENILYFYSTHGGDDGASHIVVDYKTPDMQTFEHKEVFPLNVVESKSVIRYEKSVFIPTEIFEMDLFVNSSVDVTLSFKKGAQTILIGKKYPSGNLVHFDNEEIKNSLLSSGINYSDLGNEYFFLILDLGKDNPGQNIILGKNSYVLINSTETAMPYGTIDISQEIPIAYVSNNLQSTFYRNLVWEFFLPINAIPIMADWQFGWLSTSSSTTSQEATANQVALYDSPPDDYIKAFSRLGYTPKRAEGVFIDGKNNFTLEFGPGYGVSNEASYGYLIYFIKSYVNYGDAKGKAEGGTKTIEFQDGSTRILEIGNSGDVWDPEKDALDDAVERLLTQLDSNKDGKIDLIIDEDELNVDALDISGVPFIWSTEVQIRRWR